MLKKMLGIAILIVVAANGANAQDIAGDWQGALKIGAQQLRLIIRIAKSDTGGWNALLSSIDQSPDWGAGAPADSVTLQGSEFKLTIGAVRGSYTGKLSADGNSIDGTWSQGVPLPLELQRATKENAWKDPSSHTTQLVTVDNNVKLEVLDWGGSGRPLVFLAGLGNTAHVFDKFAPKLIDAYHVYGITRRGFGASSTPGGGYGADRLGDDVLEVLDALKISRPILAGHSIAGQELSSIGSRHPEKVSGLIYLDAAYSYAFYNKAKGDLRIDAVELVKKLEQLRLQPPNTKELVEELLQTTLPQVESDLRELQKDLQTQPTPPAGAPPMPPVVTAIQAGLQKYTSIRAPALAIFALPHDLRQQIRDEAARTAAEATDGARTEAQAKAFENGVPSARVVRLSHADHYVFGSNEADVLREMRAFIAGLQ